MSNTWKNIWVVGQVNAMEAFLDAKKINDGEGGRHLPHEIFVVGPIYPQVQDGTDDNGNPKYKKKAGTQPGLWCFSLHGDQQTLVEELRLLSNPNYTILDTKIEESDVGLIEVPMSLSDIKELYPEFALGQGVPHIA